MDKEVPTYDLTQYTAQDMDYGEGFNLDLTDPDRVLETTGISVSKPEQPEEKPYINQTLRNLFNNPTDSTKLKVYTGRDMELTRGYEDMLKQVGLNDKSGAFSAKGALTKGALSSLLGVSGLFMGGGDYGFGKTLKGPTGKPVFSVGGLSEKALQRHYDNFSKVQEANVSFELQGQDIKEIDTGFAMTVDGFHFSRKPGQMFFDGHKGHLSSDTFIAHAMQKTIEALSKGLDPAGYRLDGKNENNKGAAGGNGAGGRVTEDGYYTYVANNGFGYTKSALYGGNLSDKLAQEFGTDGMTLAKAMQMARADKNLTVTQALKTLTTAEEAVSETLNEVEVSTQQEMDNRKQERADRQQKETVDRGQEAGKNYRGGYGFQEGGLVSNLATILRENRLGMNLGGQPKEQINLNELGFVGDKTPNEVTPQQSIADNRPMDVRQDDYLLNSPAVEEHGIRNVVNMIKRGLESARDAGVEIVDLPADIPKNELVKILASDSEVRIPKDLVRFIGLGNLETINEKGKPEVERRTRLT